jgi:uncharacterized membrane protein YczE
MAQADRVSPTDRLPTLRGRRLTRRLVQLYAGLALYGASMALLVRSTLGVTPWDVLHQGIARHLGWSLGTVTIVVGAVVLLFWIPLRQLPGLGTVSNVVVIGVAVDGTLAVLPAASAPAVGIGFVVAGVLLNAVATAAYIGVRLGPGPRDGLMTGLVARTGGSVRLVRTAIEAAVVLTGWLLGGTLGLGTVVYALAIGPLTHVLMPRLALAGQTGSRVRNPASTTGTTATTSTATPRAPATAQAPNTSSAASSTTTPATDVSVAR